MIWHCFYSLGFGRGCRRCKSETGRLAQMPVLNGETDAPSRYECPSCHSRWGRVLKPRMLDFFEAASQQRCTRCGKPICLNGTFGNLGEQEPEGLLINGASYCSDCMERTAEVVEEAARFVGR